MSREAETTEDFSYSVIRVEVKREKNHVQSLAACYWVFIFRVCLVHAKIGSLIEIGTM